MKRCSAKPYEGNENYIFISYCHRDKANVFPIIEQLVKDGYRVWYDEGIDPGSEWPEIIARHLDAATICLAFISEKSLNSHNCRREITFALMKRKYFISVILEPVQMSLGMEMQLSASQSIFKHKLSTDKEFFSKLYDAKEFQKCFGQPNYSIVVSNPADYCEDSECDKVRSPFSDKWFIKSDEEVRQEAEAVERRRVEEALRREAEEAVRREAEEAARRESEEAARSEAEEAARREAEEAARREAEEAARREVEAAEEAARREAEEAARREAEAAEEAARREAEEAARREVEAAEEAARREAEEAARREAEAAEEAARREAEEAARREAEEAARREAEEAARREVEAAEEAVHREAEEVARREAEEAARREAEEAVRREAEAARREAEEAARREVEEAARREAEEAERRRRQDVIRREAERRSTVLHMLKYEKINDIIHIKQPHFVIGRSERNADYVIRGNDSVSRCHAMIDIVDGICYVTDNNSLNHTYLNGRMLKPEIQYRLQHGDSIVLYNEKFVYIEV